MEQGDPWIARMNERFDRWESVLSSGFDRIEASLVKLAALYGVTIEFPSSQNASFADQPSHHAISEPEPQPSPFYFSNSAYVTSFSEEENQSLSSSTLPLHLSTTSIFSPTILEEDSEEQVSDMLLPSSLEEDQPSLCQEVSVLSIVEEHQTQNSVCVATSCEFNDD